ncbi:MAG TPA: hypothetical protein VGS21_03855 [Acidimicrobiales bacterium]|nr:hypothetical protein [Acidimicrobiales bacterium]
MDGLVFRTIAVFVATRVACLAALEIGGHHKHRSLSSLITSFDGGWYQSIALHWYPTFIPSGRTSNAASLVFFPLYPTLLAGLHHLGLSIPAAATLVDTIAAGAAAVLMAKIVAPFAGNRVALLTAALWTAYPLAVVLSLAYAESLFTALAVGTLYFLSRDRIPAAAVCVVLACLTRPSGIALVVLLVLTGIRRRSPDIVGAAASGFLAICAWMVYLDVRAHNSDAYFVAERRGWNVFFDGGVNNLSRAFHYLTHPGQRAAATAVAAMLVAIVVLLVVTWRLPDPRIPRIYVGYSLLLFVVAIWTRNSYSSIPRYMLPAFPILIPIAVLLDRLPAVVRWGLVAVAAAAMAALGVYVTLYSTYPP